MFLDDSQCFNCIHWHFLLRHPGARVLTNYVKIKSKQVKLDMHVFRTKNLNHSLYLHVDPQPLPALSFLLLFSTQIPEKDISSRRLASCPLLYVLKMLSRFFSPHVFILIQTIWLFLVLVTPFMIPKTLKHACSRGRPITGADIEHFSDYRNGHLNSFSCRQKRGVFLLFFLMYAHI